MEDAFFEKVVGEKLARHCKGLVGAGAVIVAGGCLRMAASGFAGKCRTRALILPVEWGWRSGQSHLNSDAKIADEGRPQGARLPDSGSLTWVCPNLMQLPCH